MIKPAIFIAAPLLVAAAPVQNNVTEGVSQERLRATIEKLVSFGTRHTLSSLTDPKRGIGAALNWAEGEFKAASKACGNCLVTARPEDTVTNRRIPQPTRVVDVIAIQKGTERPNDVVIITGHIDSRVTDVMNATSDAPGANDDGSGTAAVIEAARVLSRHKFPATIVYGVLSGEEQGLVGAKILADYAKAQGWNVIANLNNDIIGNSCGSDGVCNDAQVRVFSEGPRWQGGEDLRGPQRSLGGENDSPSRNLSRFVDGLADDLSLGLDVKQVWRNDRFGRGGDHTEFLNAGYPAVRFSVAIENYDWQHQNLRTENGKEYGDTPDKMDFVYLAKVTKLNVAALIALASAPPPPEPVVEGALSTDTTLRWLPELGADSYIVRWRSTDASQWENSIRLNKSDLATMYDVPHPVTGQQLGRGFTVHSFTLKGVRVDDFVFGVSSVSSNGCESPVASAVPGGAFRPYVPAPKQ